MQIHLLFLLFVISSSSYANSDSETKKTYIEDIFIWRMSDELKLTADEEKKFTEIQKNLNKQKSELNKEIQEITNTLAQEAHQSDKNIARDLKNLRKQIKDYNQISITEFDSMKRLLGLKRFASYLQIKSELTNKIKTLLSGEKTTDKQNKETTAVKLPPPQVIIEKNE